MTQLSPTQVIAGLAALASLAGCAKPFPERLNWYGEHPYLYSMAFGAAAQEALVRSRTGLGYYEHMGDAAFTLSTSGTCDRETIETYLARKERGCFLLNGPPAPDCLNASACASFRYDTALFADPAVRRVVEEALRRPCDFLTPPTQVPNRDATARFGMSAAANWRILQCDGPGVFGHSIAFDDSTAILRVEFTRGL